MDKSLKNGMLLIVFAMLLLTVSIHIDSVIELISSFISLLMPIIFGLIFAFILSVPMKFFENFLSKHLHKPITRKLSYLAFALTLLSVILVIVIVAVIVIPQLSKSIIELGQLIKIQIPKLLKILKSYNIDVSSIESWIKDFDINAFLKSLSGISGELVDSIVKVSSGVLSKISTFCIGTIIGIYILLDKKTLSSQCIRIMNAYMPKLTPGIIHVASQFQKDFSNFLSGQCFEAIILGILITIVLSVLRVPYSGLIGVLTGFCAFIPYIGATISCVIGALLTLIAAPEKTLIMIIAYLITQFVETQFIYPHVVGSSVGLSPLLTLIAVLMGGSLFGVFGMIFFIPITASIYSLLRENVARRLDSPTSKTDA
ncbi:MAG: AI-2E family transporter [Erysipelotrichaceae bacterium]